MNNCRVERLPNLFNKTPSSRSFSTFSKYSRQAGKCVVYDPRPGRAPEPEFLPGGSLAEVSWRSSSGPAKDWGVLVVGGPVGGAEFVRHSLDTGPVQATRELLQTFPRLQSRHEGLVMLRY